MRLLAKQRRQIAERGVEPAGEAGGGGAGRRAGARRQQGLDPGGRPDRGLGGERLEAALHDRQGGLVGGADPRRLVQRVVRAGPAGRPAIRSISRSASRSCATWRPGSGPARGGSGGAWWFMGAEASRARLRKD